MKLEPQLAAATLKKASRLRPKLAVVLGSGFNGIVDSLKVEKELPYAKIPGFPIPAVAGHDGNLFFGLLGGTPIIALSGRAHFYEGHSMEHVTFAVRSLAAFGIHDLLLTNAAGGINGAFKTGDFMVLKDHINFMGANPLRGTSSFVDMTQVYDRHLSELLFAAARECKMKLRRGTYVAVCGPNYETPAEVRAFARLGADAVGMSTVPEAIVARQWGVNVAGISCITNPAAGLGKRPLSHAEVLENAERVGRAGAALLERFAALYGKADMNTSGFIETE